MDERLEVDAPAQLPQQGPTATVRAGGMQQTPLVSLMVGAVTLTIVHVGVGGAIVPAMFLGVAAVLAWCRRDRTARLAADLARAGRRPPTLIGQARHG